MILFRLRDKDTLEYYQGKGIFNRKGRLYTNKGHIKNSLKQSGVNTTGRNLEVVTYELEETKTEDI